jgi:hypothetical protein
MLFFGCIPISYFQNQAINYMTVEEFIYELPREEQQMCLRLRDIVLRAAPDFDEKISYGVPYYFRHRRVCCIWPASAKAGPPRGVFLGFCRGNLLSNEQGIIEMGNRKRFGLIRYFGVSEIKEEPILEIIQEAIMVDEELTKIKKTKRLQRAR